MGAWRDLYLAAQKLTRDESTPDSLASLHQAGYTSDTFLPIITLPAERTRHGRNCILLKNARPLLYSWGGQDRWGPTTAVDTLLLIPQPHHAQLPVPRPVNIGSFQIGARFGCCTRESRTPGSSWNLVFAPATHTYTCLIMTGSCVSRAQGQPDRHQQQIGSGCAPMITGLLSTRLLLMRYTPVGK